MQSHPRMHVSSLISSDLKKLNYITKEAFMLREQYQCDIASRKFVKGWMHRRKLMQSIVEL